MKIALIQPPYTIDKKKYKQAVPPLGLAYIAAVLEAHSHTVRIIDAVIEGIDHEESAGKDFITYGLPMERIHSEVEAFEPDVIGISCPFSSQRANAYRVAEYLRDRIENTPIVFGGEHPSACPEDSLACKAVDFVVIGEGERTMLDLVEHFANEGNGSIEAIDGLAYRNAEGEMVVQPKRSFVQDLDEIPFPSRHLLPMEKYFAVNMPQGLVSRYKQNTAVIASRGCPCRCVFCSTSKFWGNRVRLRSPEQVVSEIKHLKDKYGVREIQFLDDNLTANYENAKALFELMIEEELNIRWTTPQGIAIWTLDYPLLKLMKRSGCYAITLGIESGSQRVLSEIIHKPLKLERVPEVVDDARRVGLYVFAFFVIGLPGETYEELQETFRFARDLRIDIPIFSHVLPLPGTELYDISLERGLLPEGYSFDHRSYHRPQLLTDEYDQEQIVKLLRRNQKHFVVKMMTTSPLRFLRVYSYLLRKIIAQKTRRADRN